MSIDPNATTAPAPPPMPPRSLLYRESDGKPMADNMRQWNLIVELVHGLRIQYERDPNVLVAGDLLWYPVEGDTHLSVAPDCFVVFGRHKGLRRSYLQWQEGNIAPQVVFEVLSESNRPTEMHRKFRRYERFGVEEYYEIDPDSGQFACWMRRGDSLEPVAGTRDWVSPRLGVRFVTDPDDAAAPIKLYHPDGERFLTGEPLARLAQEYKERAEEAENSLLAARARAETEAIARLAAEQRAARLAERMRKLGFDPDADDDAPPAT